jgi:DNA-binding MarR family transcriptional regulator
VSVKKGGLTVPDKQYFALTANLMRFRRLDILGRVLPIPPREAMTLFVFLWPEQSGAARQPVKISDLAGYLGVSVPACSATVRCMEEEGLLRRRRDETDHRVIYLEPTDAGWETARSCSARLLKTADQMFAVIGRDRLERLTALSEEICSAAEMVLNRMET